MTTLRPGEATAVSDRIGGVAALARRVDATDDPADAAPLAAAAETAEAELRSMRHRVLAAAGVVTGSPCDAPPDIAGLCERCGKRTARPVGEHSTGCLDDLVAPLARAARMARLIVRELGRP